jgi:hypothetical protein
MLRCQMQSTVRGMIVKLLPTGMCETPREKIGPGEIATKNNLSTIKMLTQSLKPKKISNSCKN